ncbi:hypothetical protein EHI8A_098210 [Entamoeba histolytica HM-1:IMSS-B]|nr:hypothetical protein EHI8A_098210 [Entamoeba histolytica HM-1:IMSS-B]BAN37694.1 hypothetical protein [Entamoeba histolytica]GAT96323.1 hypothetical protein CL6EHI_031380 [Entamoeba histolytica]
MLNQMKSLIPLFLFISFSIGSILPERRRLVKQLLNGYNNQIDSQIKQNKQLMNTLSEGALKGDPYPLYLKHVFNVEQQRINRLAMYLKTRKSSPFNYLKINHTPIRDKPSTDPINKICDYYNGEYNGPNGYLYKHKRAIQKAALKGFSINVPSIKNYEGRFETPSLIQKNPANDGY